MSKCPSIRAQAEQLESKITGRFLAALQLWTQQQQANRLGEQGTLTVDCVDLLLPFAADIAQRQRAQDMDMVALAM